MQSFNHAFKLVDFLGLGGGGGGEFERGGKQGIGVHAVRLRGARNSIHPLMFLGWQRGTTSGLELPLRQIIARPSLYVGPYITSEHIFLVQGHAGFQVRGFVV